MIRYFYPNKKDFRTFLELFYHTAYSVGLNEISGENYIFQYESRTNFATYCKLTKPKFNYGYLAFVNKHDQVIAGLRYTVNDNTCTINEFFVLRVYQLSGIGTKFFNEFENFISLKYPLVNRLELISYTAGSVEFWEKMGFTYKNYNYEKSI